MSIAAGQRFGPYEIVAPLGAGGMGEVYRAKDTRLDRIVAIKILNASPSSNSDLRQRFEREARAVSSLNHSNICILHDIGNQAGVDFLVMEYIEGETLASRLQRGPLSTAEVLQYSIQITDALDKAHKRSIVHRDLKPGNIMITKSGIKLLDFGLAKLIPKGPLAQDLSQLATAGDLTAKGTILGTVQYMSPEQLEGKEIDPRTDIFAFGTVLYEMATGKRAFEGKSQASLIAAILKEDPKPISQHQPLAPARLERLVKICLEKDPDDRWQTAHDLKLELQGIMESFSRPESAMTYAIRLHKRQYIPWTVAVLCAVAAITWPAVFFRSSTTKEQRVLQMELVPPHEDAFFSGTGPLAVSPNGKYIAFNDNFDGRRTLWLRAFDSSEARQLPGTEHSINPFWSPDSRYLAFFARGKLMKIDVGGGRPQVLCDVEFNRGGSWGKSGIIIFAERPNGPIYQIPASGGTPKPITKLNQSLGEVSHRFPHFLPDGRRFLYLARLTQRDQGLYAGSLDSAESKFVTNISSRVVYTRPGYLLFVEDSDLMAHAIDLKSLELKGDPVLIAKDVGLAATGQAGISVSDEGLLAFWGATLSGYQLLWFDRNGKQLGVAGESSLAADLRYHRLSPDGSHVAWLRPDPDLLSPDIWVTDLTRNISTRLTSRMGFNQNPTWSPDGKTIVFNRDAGMDNYTIYRMSAGGVGGEEVFIKDGVILSDWSLNGEFIIGQRIGRRFDPWIVPLAGDRKPFAFAQSEFNELQGAFSPDTRWIAYTSDESGEYEVYVQSFPSSGKKVRISTNGGAQPRWRRDGKELFYLSLERKVMSVEVSEKDGELRVSVPQPLFKTLITTPSYPFGSDYDITADGQRFLTSTSITPTRRPISVILNWTQLLKK
ncbi:protein kinase [bacterium]|nr:protein kinase [bacterium]